MDSEALGKLLIRLRERDGKSQKEIAEMLCVSASTVCKWENGKNTPCMEIVKKLVEIFHCTYEDLYHPEEALQRLDALLSVLDDGSSGNASDFETETISVPEDFETTGMHSESMREPDSSSSGKRKCRYWQRAVIVAVLIFIVFCSASVLRKKTYPS